MTDPFVVVAAAEDQLFDSSLRHSHTRGTQSSHHLRGSIGSNETVTGEGRIMESETPRIIGKDDPSRITEDGRSDRVARNMYDAVSSIFAQII